MAWAKADVAFAQAGFSPGVGMTAKMTQVDWALVRSLACIVSVLTLCATEAKGASLQVRIGNTVLVKEVKSIQDLKYEQVVRQTTDYSCGAAALATILTHYFGRQTTEQEILTAVLQDNDEATVARIMKQGISLLDLKNFAARLGIECKGYRLKIHELSGLDRPAIVLINAKGYSHFVVVKGIVADKIYLADPVKGNQILRLDEFARTWNGILLAFGKTDLEKIQTNALCAKQILPDDKLRLFPSLTDVASFARTPADF
jgi:uncharacterized protein